MIVQTRVYKRFLTKKKLSSFAWTYWGFALITTIGIGFLFTIVEILKTHDRNVIFYNIRTVNTENNKIDDVKNEVSLNNNSPVFVFVKENVLFGSLKSVIAPMPNNDVLVLNKNWQDDFKLKIIDFKNRNKIFPAKAFGVIFDSELPYDKNIDLLKKTFDLISSQNKNTKNNIHPSIVLLDPIKLN